MEHHLGGEQHRQHGVDRVLEDHESASNAGKVEPQTRTMRDYVNPTKQIPISSIVLLAHHTMLNLKSGMLQALP